MKKSLTYSEMIFYIVSYSDFDTDDELEEFDDDEIWDILRGSAYDFRDLFDVSDEEFIKDIREEFKKRH